MRAEAADDRNVATKSMGGLRSFEQTSHAQARITDDDVNEGWLRQHQKSDVHKHADGRAAQRE
eukprot:3647317-Pleurochrysis_carterae.AAC.3